MMRINSIVKKVVQLALVVVTFMALTQYMNSGGGAMACGNELNQVISACGGIVFSGGRPAYNSPCCVMLRSVSLPCLCSQASSYGGSSGISPSTAANIRSGCQINIPKGTACAGFNG